MARKTKKSEWKFIDTYDVTEYQCGLKAGDWVRLKRDLHLTLHDGTPAGVNRAGEIWRVLSGASEDPGVVWLRQPDGDRHTWSDDPTIFDWFEKVDPAQIADIVPQPPVPSPQPPAS
jgi:hypothetical protein